MRLDLNDIKEKLDWKVTAICALALWLGYSSCSPPSDVNLEERRISSAVKAAEDTPKYQADGKAIEQARKALSDAQFDLIGRLEYQQASVILAKAKDFLARAQAMSTDQAFSKCYQKATVSCLWSFADNRLAELSQPAKSADQLDRTLLLNTDIQAVLLAIALATPEDSRLEVENAWINQRFKQAIASTMSDPQVQNLTIYQHLSLARTAAQALEQVAADLSDLYQQCLEKGQREINQEICKMVGVE